jgi:flagellar protein FliO/FliZ
VKQLNSNHKNSIFLIPLVALFTFVMVFSSMEVHADDHTKSVADKYRESNNNEDTKTDETDGNTTNDESNEVSEGNTTDGESDTTTGNTTDGVDDATVVNTTPTLVGGESAGKNLFVLLIQLVFYTGIVVFMIYALIKFLSVRQRKLQRNNVFQVVSGVSVGNNKTLQLVKAGNKMYFIGVGDNVTLLKEIEDENEIASLQEDIEASEASPLATGIGRLLNKKEANTSDENNKSEFSTFQKLMKNTMEKQKEKRNTLENELRNRSNEDENR